MVDWSCFTSVFTVCWWLELTSKDDCNSSPICNILCKILHHHNRSHVQLKSPWALFFCMCCMVSNTCTLSSIFGSWDLVRKTVGSQPICLNDPGYVMSKIWLPLNCSSTNHYVVSIFPYACIIYWLLVFHDLMIPFSWHSIDSSLPCTCIIYTSVINNMHFFLTISARKGSILMKLTRASW